MSDISQLEHRITAALDRIRQGLDAAAAGQAGGGDAALQAALDKERAANDAMVARVDQLKERQETQVAALTAKVDAQSVQMQKLDAELQTLRASNRALREMNTKLRDAVTRGMTPELHDAAAAAELDALAAQRAADVAEMDAILAELKPLITGAANATN